MTKGFKEDELVEAALKPRFDLVPFGAIEFSRGDRWLIKGLLAARGLATIFGPPKQYKSFVALDVALHVAAGTPWAGCRVKKGAVVYIVGEGATGFSDRVAGNRVRDAIPPDLPFFLVKARPNLGVAVGDTLELIRSIEPVIIGLGIPLAAIFVDTLVRTLAGASENDEGMRNFTDNAEAIADHFECLAVAVHHTGKDTARGMRGSSALHGAVVTSWKVEKVQNFQARITLEDAKDGESGLSWTADLERFVFGRDEDGDEESILIVSSVSKPEREAAATDPSATEGDTKGKRPPPPQLKLFLACLDTAMASDSKLERPYADGPQIRVVPQQAVKAEYFHRRGDDASDDAKRKSFDNQIKSAIERRLVSVMAVGSDKVVWRLQ